MQPYQITAPVEQALLWLRNQPKAGDEGAGRVYSALELGHFPYTLHG